MTKHIPPRPILSGQTIVYCVLAALERGATQVHFAKSILKKYGYDFTSKQISRALQQLRKEGLAEYRRCMWQLKTEDRA